VSRDRRGEVLDATYECLTRYGVRRTTMEDIASVAGMSRAAVYQYVRNKDDAFRGLAIRLHEAALAQAQAAASGEGTPEQRIRGVLDAKLQLVLGMLTDSSHTAELLDEKGRLFGDICTQFTSDIVKLLTALLLEAGISTLRPEQAADICVALVVGLESRPDAAQLLAPAADAVIDGLLRPRLDTPRWASPAPASPPAGRPPSWSPAESAKR
jgi:AcrR family transcriptional regulator